MQIRNVTNISRLSVYLSVLFMVLSEHHGKPRRSQLHRKDGHVQLKSPSMTANTRSSTSVYRSCSRSTIYIRVLASFLTIPAGQRRIPCTGRLFASFLGPPRPSPKTTETNHYTHNSQKKEGGKGLAVSPTDSFGVTTRKRRRAQRPQPVTKTNNKQNEVNAKWVSPP